MYVTRYNHIKLRLYERRIGLLNREKFAIAFLMACLTALGAQVYIFLPFTPVPITLQVFFVLMSGVVLGKGFGGLSQVMYLGMGLVGLPVFAEWNGGVSILLGVSGGYLLGFVVASTIIGWAIDSKNWRSKKSLFGLMLLGTGIIYAIGSIQLALILQTGFLRTLNLGVFPFVAGDLLKAVTAAFFGAIILPIQTQIANDHS